MRVETDGWLSPYGVSRRTASSGKRCREGSPTEVRASCPSTLYHVTSPVEMAGGGILLPTAGFSLTRSRGSSIMGLREEGQVEPHASPGRGDRN
jgi:hypothetical protein